MKTIEGLVQGSDAWKAHRAHSRNASDASALMGASPYVTRTELLRRRATGIEPEVSPQQQAIFDEGHRVEPLMREMCEELLGDDLAPLVAESDDGYLSASFDGVTLDGTKLFEAKQRNAEKIAAIREDRIPDVDYFQIVQQFAVCETAQVLYYYCGDGTPEHTAYYTQRRTPQIEADITKLRVAWAQFDKELEAYEPEPVVVEPVGHAPGALPAVLLQVTGAVTDSNLNDFRDRALAVIGGINRNLQTDQDFVDAAASVQWCKTAEERLAAAKSAALAQTASIDEAFRIIDEVSKALRDTRLSLDKLVKEEKRARKEQLVLDARRDYEAEVDSLNRTLERPWVQREAIPFADAIKGLSSLASMKDKLNVAVGEACGAAKAKAMAYRRNRETLKTTEQDWITLFADFGMVGSKSPEDFDALMQLRITQAKAAEAKRIEAERERIREEEARKLAIAEAKRVEAERLQAERIRAEEEAKARAEAGVKTGARMKEIEVVRGGHNPTPQEAFEASGERIPAEDELNAEPTLTLAALNNRIAPWILTGDGARKMGIKPTKVRSAWMFSEHDFARLMVAACRHFGSIQCPSDPAREPKELEANHA